MKPDAKSDDRSPATLAALRAAADESRLRILRLLDLAELSVGELADAVAMTQSSVSRHLTVLRAAGLVEERSEGVRTYVRAASAPPAGAAPLFAAVLAAVRAEDFGHADDLARLERVRRERDVERESAFDALAADWDAMRHELLGGRLAGPDIASLLAPRGMRIVDAGAGTGVSLPWLSVVAGDEGRVVAVERSAAMLARSRERAATLANVEVRRGKIEELPVADRWADALVLSLSLRQTADPAAALARCVRAVKPGGRVVVADVLAHGDAHLVEKLGRGFAGFAPDELTSLLRGAGLESVRVVELPKSPQETNGARAARARAIPRLAPLLAVGVVPSAKRATKRRER
jgi:DNA-binding transcriptional ArsR family regulator/precorrin-6B methylase 2